LIRQRNSALSEEDELDELRSNALSLLSLCPVRSTRVALLETMLAVAFADDIITPREETRMRLVAQIWRIPGDTYLTLLSNAERFFNATQQSDDADQDYHRKEALAPESPLGEAYKTLAISPESSLREIKKAYRQLAMLHHPDKYRTGTADHSRAHANFQAIQSAYEMIVNARESVS
jgi:DnaJ like chaperone protein